MDRATAVPSPQPGQTLPGTEAFAGPEASPKGIVLILAATALWSTTPIFIQPLVTVHHLTPLDVSAWRAFLVTPVLGIVILMRQPEAFRISRPEIPYLAGCGIVGIALFNVLWSASVQVNQAPVATALVFSAPTFVAIGSRFIFGERLGAIRMAAVALALLGCALVAGVRHPSALIHNPAGLELGISSGAAFAAYTLFGKGASRLWGRSPLTVLFYVFLFSALLLLVWGLAAEGWGLIALNTDSTGWILLVSLALGPSLGGYALYTTGLTHLPAGLAALFTTLEPPITAALAAIFLGKTMNGTQWIGTALILAGVLAVQGNLPRMRTPLPAADN